MLSVYLVDDESIILRGLTKLIDWQYYGFFISGMSNSSMDALKNINTNNTDIVITDLKMPDMDGMELCEILHQKYPSIKFIVLSAYDDFAYMQKSIRNGVADYLLKPVKEKMLLESLAKVRNDLVAERENYAYPFDIECNIVKNIIQANVNQVNIDLTILFEDIETYKVPVSILKKICYGILKSLNYNLEQEGSGFKEILKEDILKEDIFSQSSSQKEIYDKLKNILNKVLIHRNGLQQNDLIVTIKKYISENLNKDISLNMVAKHFYINASYLSQTFKKYTGKNYSYYVTEKKILYAKRLLKDKNLQIQQISELVGYTDYRYFSQTFKKYTGKAPSEYRMQL